MQNEANGLIMDGKPSQCNLTSRQMPILEQRRSGSQNSNTSSPSFANKESTNKFDFFGWKQQMSSQQPEVLQSLAWQQAGINDAQLVQQQATLRQMQLQRQHHIQQQNIEAMQRNTINHMSSFSNQAGNHAPSFINDILMHEAPNYPCSSQVMAGSPNWLQTGTSPAVQGYTNGVMMPHEQGKSLHLTGLVPQQVPQSLYGIPVSEARSGGGFVTNEVDKTPQGHFSSNQHCFFTQQMNLRDETTVPRQEFEGRAPFEHTTRQGSGNAISVEKQMKQRSVPHLDGRQDVVSMAPFLPDKTLKQVASSQAPVSLDPTEEKILFGSDDNIWDVFGGSLSESIGGFNISDGAFPSIQSGSWSALMQSAVAESSSSGVDVQNSGSMTGNQQLSGFPEESQSHESAYLSGDFSSKHTEALQPNHSFSSQGFGLQLAPPNFPMTSQDLLHTVKSPSSSYFASGKGDKSWLAPAASCHSLSSVHNTQQVEAQITRSDSPVQIRESLACNTQGNFPASFSSDPLHLKSLVHNREIYNAEVKANDQPYNVSLDRQASNDKQVASSVTKSEATLSPCSDHSDAQVSMQQMAALNVSSPLQPSILSGIFQKSNLSSMIPNQWTNMPTPQQFLVKQSLKAAELLENRYQSNNVPGTNASIQQKQDFLESVRKGDSGDSQGFVGMEEQPMSVSQAGSTQKTELVLQGRETFAANPSDGYFSNSAARKNVIQAFGRSLKPSSNMPDNYALLYQMQTIKEMDPNILQVKRFKGPDLGHSVGNSEHSGRLDYPDKSASASSTSVSSADAKIPSLIPANHIRQQHADVDSENLLSCQGEPRTLSDSNVAPRGEHSQISLQMAPNWFKQYETFTKGQVIPVHDMQRAQLVASTEQHFLNTKPLKNLGAENVLVFNVTAPSVASLRPNKRKSDAIDMLPWHKEVTLGYQRLPNMWWLSFVVFIFIHLYTAISYYYLYDLNLAEEHWAQAAHRSIEKIKGEINVYDDASPVVQSRKRLVVTTQLMQQIFQPLPASCLSLNASKECETVAYFASRLALADACNLTCQSESDSCIREDGEKLSEKTKADSRISDQYINKVVEQFINIATKLDNELQRLNSVSVLDLRLECQDLEKVSVINRFARFHGQRQVNGTDSSSSDAAARAHKVHFQRYVNACPTPKNLPERVQCLSL